MSLTTNGKTASEYLECLMRAHREVAHVITYPELLALSRKLEEEEAARQVKEPA